ncbi:MAG TPA: biotin/lipoyl-binding protein [Candidatus Saccharimonadia bacterium]|nr:biotin/lipoyl-binding protein [Candidatus Saccharimonadia bacterium]
MTMPSLPVKTYITKIRAFFKKIYGKAMLFVDKHPLSSFFAVMGALVLIIVVSNIARRPAPVTPAQVNPKDVSVYRIGQSPTLTAQAIVDKPGVIQITALSGGVVSRINVTEGQIVARGKTLLSLSSSYSGGNVSTIQRQLAQAQNQNVEDTYPLQKDAIGKQRDLANVSENNFEKLRDITGQSINDTQSIINLNNSIISTLSTNITNLQNSGDASTSAGLILSSQQMLSQFQSANAGLNAQLRNAQYQTDTTKPPTDLAIKQRDLTLRQLDIQDKAQDLNLAVSRLQLQLAKVGESLMYPSAPFSAKVEKVDVRVGQVVNPGTPLFTLMQVADPTLTATAYVTSDVASRVSRTTASTLHLSNGKTISVVPSFISDEATQGTLYSIVYEIPQSYTQDITDKGYVSVELPIGYPDTSELAPYIPLDSIYETQEQSYIFVVKDGVVSSKTVTLGSVSGRYVQVNSGIEKGDVIILDRNVVAGDHVQVTN